MTSIRSALDRTSAASRRKRNLAYWALSTLAMGITFSALQRNFADAQYLSDPRVEHQRLVSRVTDMLLPGTGIEKSSANAILSTRIPAAPNESSGTTATALPTLPAGDSIAPPPAFIARGPSLARIPEFIEGAQRAHRLGDPLGPLTIEPALRVFDMRAAPFQLLAIRLEPGPARVRLQWREEGAHGRPLSGWLEVGDSPDTGWRVVSIRTNDVLLLSPMGNPVLLHPKSGGTSAESLNASGVLPRT